MANHMDPTDGVQPRPGDSERPDDVSATPQLEHGFAPVANEILWALAVYGPNMPRPATAWPIMMHVFENTYGQFDPSRRKRKRGFRNKIDFVTTRPEIALELFLERRSTNRALASLENNALLIIEVLKSSQRKDLLLIRFNKNYRTWKGFPDHAKWSGTKRSHRSPEIPTQNEPPTPPVSPNGPSGKSVGPNGPSGSFGETGVSGNNEADPHGVDRSLEWDQTVPPVGPNGPTELDFGQQNSGDGEFAIQEQTKPNKKKNDFRERWDRTIDIANEEGYTTFRDLESQWFGGNNNHLELCKCFVGRSEESQRFAFKQFVSLRQELTKNNQLKFLPTKLPSIIPKLIGFADAYTPDSDQEWLNGS